MKNIFILLIFTILLSSCGVNQVIVKETNVPFTDEAMAATRIDTSSIVGTYLNLDRDIVFFKDPAAFKQPDSVSGGIVYRKDTYSGETLIVPSRFFVTDEKGRKILNNSDVPITAPFLNEITGFVADSTGHARYSEVHLKIDGGNEIGGDTFLFIPDVQRQNRYTSNRQTSSSSHVIRLRRATPTINQNRQYQTSDVRYRLALLTCGQGCNPNEVFQSGFLIEDNTRRIYFIYEGRKYYITVSLSNQEWCVLADSAGVAINGFYLEVDQNDSRKKDVATSKRLGQ
ncbi:MAG: hypothetical protein MRY57_03855 [Candidatus Pacebacteria bacterium]|nr:hypothetical protein [Candidatus Paceibacterota bacterium]